MTFLRFHSVQKAELELTQVWLKGPCCTPSLSNKRLEQSLTSVLEMQSDRSPSCRHICKEPISFHFYKVEYLIKRFYTFWGNWKIIKNFYCECFNITVKYIIPFFLSVLCTKSSGHSADKIFFIMFGNKFTDWMEFSKIYICTAYEIWRYGSKVYFVFEQNINHLLFYVFWGFTKIFRKSRRCFETPFFKQCV